MFVGGEIDLGEDRGELDGNVVGGVRGESINVLLETFGGFLFTEDRFSEEVEIDGGSLLPAEGEVFFERGGLGGEDDFLRFFAETTGDGGHDDAGEEARGEGTESHETAVKCG